jgi:hypothetical protein
MNKRREVEVIIEMYKPKIIGIVESWCNSSILDSEVSFEGFNLFRKDKIGSNGVGGGALLYIHKSLEAAQYYDLDEIKMETSIWCEVKLTKEENILVGLVYRSPNSSAENNEALRNQLLRIETTRHDKNLLIFGDFNFREINWKTSSVRAGITSEPQLFLDTVQDLLLVQHVVHPTRHREGQRPSLLDLVLTDDDNSIEDIIHTAPIGKSDHDNLHWTYICRTETICSKRERLNYAKGDYQAISERFASIDWNFRLEDVKCEEAWEIFKQEYHNAVKESVPIKKPRNSSKPLWMKSRVNKSVKKKHKMYMKYRRTQRYKDYLDYVKQRNMTKKIVRDAQASYEKKIMKEFKEKPKQLYNYVRSKQKVKAGISRLEDEEGNLTNTGEEAANVLNGFFESVFTQEPEGDVPELSPRHGGEKLFNCEFTVENVKEQIKKLKIDKSTGTDGTHP